MLRGGKKRSNAQNLLARMGAHERLTPAFLYDPPAPFANSFAGRDARMMEVQQKVSGCFLTLFGAEVFAHIRSHLSTVRKRERNLLDALVKAVLGEPFAPLAAPSGQT